MSPPGRLEGRGRTANAVAAAWVLTLGIDVLLHGGLLARLYVAPSPFLLPAEVAFRRIPLGYLAFLGLIASLGWLVGRLGVRGASAGFRLGISAGAVVWGALAVGLYSISTAALPLLAGWWIGQALELGAAGALLGASAAGTSQKRLWGFAAVGLVACAVATIVLQSVGWAPPMKRAG